MTPDSAEAVRRHLHELLDDESAHRSFDAALDGFPPELYGAVDEGLPYSAWQLLEHVRIAQRDIIDFCTNPSYKQLEWPDDYWPDSAEPDSPMAWADSVANYRQDRRKLMELLDNEKLDLLAEIPHGQGQTYLREFLLVADHTAYHTGQLITVRRLLGAWPTAR